MVIASRIIRAPRGSTRTCKGWPQEAALRMLMNNLDPDVAERPEDLVVYGGSGRAARSWPAFDAIVASLRALEDDETLLVQSGKPVAVFRTHREAPRVLIANALLVPAWATVEHFRDLEDRGLTMYGQMTAGSWIYIGTQGILQGTYETLAAVGRRHFGGSLAGRLLVTAGLGGMGGAQPLAATMNGGVALCVEVDPARIERRLATRYVDDATDSLDDALERVGAVDAREDGALDCPVCQRRRRAAGARRTRRHAGCPDRSDICARSAERLRAQRSLARARQTTCANGTPPRYTALAMQAIARARAGDAGAGAAWRGDVRLRQQHPRAGADRRAWPTRSRSPASCRSTCARCSARARARSAGSRSPGDPDDIAVADDAVLELFPHDEGLARWIRLARERVAFQGLPARICWLGLGARAEFGLRLNALVRSGRISAPIVIGRDHLDTGSVASPNRETEGMRDGSDAIADWPVLNALLNASCGATWVSVHHGGGVGIGYSLHAGMVIVADGTRDADARLERVLTCDPGIGVARHADAGYPEAVATAERHGVTLPMRNPAPEVGP